MNTIESLETPALVLDREVLERNLERMRLHLAGHDVRLSALIELDVDGHRAGVKPDSELLLELGRRLAGSRHVQLRGVMTHAGESYNCRIMLAPLAPNIRPTTSSMARTHGSMRSGRESMAGEAGHRWHAGAATERDP
jgi:D-serine deaminase-like pyridoxal phosphate-dependent protein